MPKRGENIYKRKDGRWEGRYIRGRTASGQAEYGYVYADSYKACRAKRQQCIETLNREIEVYMVLLDRAFIEDAVEAFKGSVALARHVGVPESDILKTKGEVDYYFVG